MRFAQPVLRRMLRTWLAAVCSLIDSRLPSCRLLSPSATSLRIWASRGESPSGSAAAGGRAERPDAGSSAGIPIRRPARRPRRAAARPASRSRPARAGSARTRRPCARARCRRPCARLSSSARSKCASARVVLAEHRRRACRGSGRPRRSRRRGGRSSRCCPRTARARGRRARRSSSSPSARGGVGEVDERGEPERGAERVEPVGDEPAQLAPRLVLHAQLGEHGDEPRPPRAAALRVGRRAPARPARARPAARARGGR